MALPSCLTCSFPVSPGQVSTQRAILEVQKHRRSYKDSVDAFVEEAVVRRELAENFCYYNDSYDSVQGKILGHMGRAGYPTGHSNLAIPVLLGEGLWGQ